MKPSRAAEDGDGWRNRAAGAGVRRSGEFVRFRSTKTQEFAGLVLGAPGGPAAGQELVRRRPTAPNYLSLRDRSAAGGPHSTTRSRTLSTDGVVNSVTSKTRKTCTGSTPSNGSR